MAEMTKEQAAALATMLHMVQDAIQHAGSVASRARDLLDGTEASAAFGELLIEILRFRDNAEAIGKLKALRFAEFRKADSAGRLVPRKEKTR